MTQLYLLINKATTILATGGWAATTAFPIPSWAPDIEHIGTLAEEPHNIRASTSQLLRGGLGANPVAVLMTQASARAYRIDGGRNIINTLYTVILHYRAVGELVR